MVDTTVFVLHYSDDEIHPLMKENNLALNELLLRCVQTIKRNTRYPHKLVIVDNGSPEVGHEDAVNLLKEHGLAPEFLWVREPWHPVAVGANRAMDALETDYMAFITSDMKPGIDWLQYLIEPLKTDPWHMTACEPNITQYGVGDPNLYRTPSFWKKLQLKSGKFNAESVADYFEFNGVDFELDVYNEPNPQCKPHIMYGNDRISIFTASRDFIDVVGRYDEYFLRACEYQYYFQAMKNGIEKPTSVAGYTYLPHRGSLFRTGVGAYHPSTWKHHPTSPTSKTAEMEERPGGRIATDNYRYERGKFNVFAKKDNLHFRKSEEGKYEVYNTKTKEVLMTTTVLSEAITHWEGL